MPYEKPGPLEKVTLMGSDGKPQLGFTRNGVTWDSQGQIVDNPQPYENPGAGAHPTAGMVNGKPAFGLYAPGKGWTDPDTGQPLKGFTPPPAFATTGMWQPTEGVDPKTGQLVPGMLDERTGRFQMTMAPGGGAAALPRDVTSELGKELQTAREADKRLRIMESNEQAALNGDQQAMVSLVANHIGMTLGAQKGARINQAVWNEAVQSAPWLQRATARFGKDGYLSGVTLAPDQIRQMVELGQVVRDNQWQQTEQAFGQYGIPITLPTEQHGSGTGATSPTDVKPPAGATGQAQGSDGRLHWVRRTASGGFEDMGVAH